MLHLKTLLLKSGAFEPWLNLSGFGLPFLERMNNWVTQSFSPLTFFPFYDSRPPPKKFIIEPLCLNVVSLDRSHPAAAMRCAKYQS